MKAPSELLEKIRNTIRNVAPKAEIILFGSRARGDARSDSDFDILILEDADSISYSRRKEITYPLYLLGYDENIDIQPIVKTRKEWEERSFRTPFYLNVTKDAICL